MKEFRKNLLHRRSEVYRCRWLEGILKNAYYKCNIGPFSLTFPPSRSALIQRSNSAISHGFSPDTADVKIITFHPIKILGETPLA